MDIQILPEKDGGYSIIIYIENFLDSDTLEKIYPTGKAVIEMVM